MACSGVSIVSGRLRQRGERLFEPGDGLAVGRPARRPCRPASRQIARPPCPMSRPGGRGGRAARSARPGDPRGALDGLDDPRVEHPPALLQQAAVGDLVRERVLEGVLEIREEAGLVEELGGLEWSSPPRSASSGSSAIACEQRERHVLADDRGGLEQAFVLRGEPVDARGQHRLDRGRNLDASGPVASADTRRAPLQRLRLHQRPDALLQEERVARASTRSCLRAARARDRRRASASSSSPALSAGSASSRIWL